jgi:hypothetical protein
MDPDQPVRYWFLYSNYAYVIIASLSLSDARVKGYENKGKWLANE